MHYLSLMQRPKCKYQLSNKELYSFFGEPLYSEHILIQIPSLYIVQKEVDSHIILKHKVHP